MGGFRRSIKLHRALEAFQARNYITNEDGREMAVHGEVVYLVGNHIVYEFKSSEEAANTYMFLRDAELNSGG